jgi:poly-gamma-glutamate synthesis protein (capsule biosynthesis protein)
VAEQTPTNAAVGAGSEPPAGEPDPRADDFASVQPADGTAPASSPAAPSAGTTPAAPTPPGGFTIAFAGDVNFAGRTADRLAADPGSVFGVAAPGLAAADLTVVNLETAITTGGDPEPKQFTFRAPPSALTALADAGIDVASMANNHGADYGRTGLDDTVAAIGKSGLPVIGVGANETQAMAPFRTTIHGAEVAIFAATAVHDHTLESWTATGERPGVASAFDPQLVANVTAAAAKGETVIVFLHWGTEYVSCPDDDQLRLADQLAGAGAAAVVGAHAHVLQGAGWRPNGTYIAYGLSNFLWWRSFGNEQDDNGVLTLRFEGKRVTQARFAPSHLDDSGVPVPATGTQAERITSEWQQDRECTNLADEPPR